MASSASSPAQPAVAPAKAPVAKPLPVAKLAKQPLAANTYMAIVAAITALIVIVSLFVGYRLLAHIILDIKVIAKEHTATSNLTQKLKDADTVVSNYNSLGTPAQQLISDALPTSPQFTQLVALMDQLSSSSGVQLKSMAPTAQNGAGGAGSSGAGTPTPAPSASSGSAPTPTPYAYSVEVEGPYNQVVSYFHNLELSARPMRVLDVSFRSSSGTDDVKADLDIQTYYQAQADISDKQVTVK